MRLGPQGLKEVWIRSLGLATFFMPTGLGKKKEDERNYEWITAFCPPTGGKHDPLWCDRQSHLWANSGKIYTNLFHLCKSMLQWCMELLTVLHWFDFFPSLSGWEECVLHSRPRSCNEATRSLANTHGPNQTVLFCQVQQQTNCYRRSSCSWHWIHLH